MKYRALLGIIMVGIAVGMSGCSEKKDIEIDKTMVCSLENVPTASTWKFDINKNNQILKMTLNTNINKDNLKKTFPKASREDLEQIYLEQLNKLGSDYKYITSKYPQAKSWFEGTLSYDNSKLEVKSNYMFNVIHERFNYSLEDGFLSEFEITRLYNNEKEAFFYDEAKIKQYLFQDNNKLKCKKE